jgi:uncharacterized membrane protein
MAKDTDTFVFLGAYADEAAARTDYEVVKDLHATGVIGTYDSAVITKDAEGKVHVDKDSIPTRRGAWGGAGVGALLGILFPPSIIVTAAVGATVGGVGAHLWKGLSRGDMKDLGEILDQGQAALLVIGDWRLEEALDRAFAHAERRLSREIRGLERAQVEEEIGRLMSGAGSG